MAKTNGQPGTVSKILWHFTGGPKWNSKTDRQATIRKPAPQACQALTSILRSKELRLGGYAELARVVVPERRQFDRIARKMVIERDVTVTIRSAAVCCLADIPIAHLSYHQSRYGQFAIGFHREAAVRHGFNPVLYTLEDTHLIQSIYNGLAELESINFSQAYSAASEVSGYLGDCEHDDIDHLRMHGEEAAEYIAEIERSVEHANQQFEKVLAFVKTFDKGEFSSIYCEREWRSTKPFKFTLDDIAMLVLPHGKGKKRYYSDFIRDKIRQLNLPRKLPVVPWEDLVEN